MPITLYDLCGADQEQRFSPYCWRAKMALAHKGLDVDEVPIPFTRIGTIADGSFSTVPVIKDRGRFISDSWDIAVYLEETYSDRPFLFGGPSGLKLSRFIETWVNLSVNPWIRTLIIKNVHDILAPEDQTYFRRTREQRFGRKLEDILSDPEAARKRLRQSLAPAEKCLANQPYLGGEAPLYADFILFGSIQWANQVGRISILKADSAVHAWFHRCLAEV